MMGDVIEYGQWKFHIRQESLVFGGGSLGFKIGTGLTSAIIIAIYEFGPVIIWGVAIVVLLFYKLDKIYSKVMADLAEREARGEL